jgi:hypothetical protein
MRHILLGFDASLHSGKLPSSIKSSNRGVLNRSDLPRLQMLSMPCDETPYTGHPANQTPVLREPATLGGHRGRWSVLWPRLVGMVNCSVRESPFSPTPSPPYHPATPRRLHAEARSGRFSERMVFLEAVIVASAGPVANGFASRHAPGRCKAVRCHAPGFRLVSGRESRRHGRKKESFLLASQ